VARATLAGTRAGSSTVGISPLELSGRSEVATDPRYRVSWVTRTPVSAAYLFATARLPPIRHRRAPSLCRACRDDLDAVVGARALPAS